MSANNLLEFQAWMLYQSIAVECSNCFCEYPLIKEIISTLLLLSAFSFLLHSDYYTYYCFTITISFRYRVLACITWVYYQLIERFHRPWIGIQALSASASKEEVQGGYFLPDTIATHHHPRISLPPIHCTTLTPMKVPGNNKKYNQSQRRKWLRRMEKIFGQGSWLITKSGNGYYYYLLLRNRCPVNGRQTQGTHLY